VHRQQRWISSLLTGFRSMTGTSGSCTESSGQSYWSRSLALWSSVGSSYIMQELTNVQREARLIRAYPVPDGKFDRERHSLRTTLFRTIATRLVRRRLGRCSLLLRGRNSAIHHPRAEFVRSSSGIAIHKASHVRLSHRRSKNAHNSCKSLYAGSRDGTRSVRDEDNARTSFGGCVESSFRCWVGDDTRLVAVAVMSGLEMLCGLSRFSCVGDDASDRVPVFE
jgi:hypothetical protein